MIQSINPFNNKVIQEYQEHTLEAVRELIAMAANEQKRWLHQDFSVRAEVLEKVASLLDEQSDDLAQIITEEMGKPLSEAKSEIKKCAWVCRFYAEKAEKFLEDDIIETDFAESYVKFEPLGCVLGIMPWNFPFWQVFRFAAPTLMAGNAVILKHASNVTGCSLAIERLFKEAGLPRELFASLIIGSEEVDAIIENSHISAVTLTGSAKAGRAVAAKAGEQLKKSVLELGGSDAYIIARDADLEKAAKLCAKSRLLNSGQSCIAAKRFIVDHEIYDSFVELFKKEFENQTLGDPTDSKTTLGPMARTDLRDKLHDQVQKSIDGGAELLLGGTIPDGEGAFYEPTILLNVKPGMPAFDEEMFGPVAAIVEAKDMDEAIELANDSKYGLGGGIFSKDVDLAEQIARKEFESGACFINDFVKSDPRLPFGGIEESGYGRELASYGIKEFVNAKTICINK